MRADYANNHVKRLIPDRHTNAGDQLDVSGNVRDLGVSRKPVILALSRLAYEHFVTISL